MILYFCIPTCIVLNVYLSPLQTYTVDEQRKKDQVEVDKQVLDAIRKNSEKKVLFGYLGSMFALKSKQYPHKMVF